MIFNNPISSPVRGLIIGTWFAALVWWERRHALRRTVDSKMERDVRNMAVAALAGAVMQFVEVPVAFGLAEQVQEKRWGLVQQLSLPAAAGAVLAIVLLDYTLYLWHVLTHRVPFLWRFHEVHHIDREMDATTALRFHFGEIAISVVFRAAQVLTIGPAPMAVASWQIFCIHLHFVPSFECSAAITLGAPVGEADSYAAFAWNPSFDCSQRSEFQLVKWPHDLGLVAWHFANGSAAGFNRAWSRRAP